MAKAKKQAITLEDKLAQALVPDDEQPYEVPSNWVWTRLKYILDVRDGTHDTPKYKEKGIPLITSKNLIGNNLDFRNVKFISEEDHIKISERSGVSDGDILMAMIGTIGNPVVVQKSQEFSIKNVALFKRLSSTDIKPKYICNFLKSSEEHMREHASGGLQPFVSLSYLRNYPVPLLPIAEQQRIVDRIESLFEKLDNAKELTQNALDTFETRKAAILHKAFTGELTAQWREKNGLRMDSWEKKRFGDSAEIKSNLVDPKDYLTYPHIAPDNIEKRTGLLLDYRTIEEDGVTSGKHRFYAGQILYSKIRPYLSKVVIVDFDGLCSADMYPIEAKGDTKYLWYYMLSDEFLEQASSAGSRSVLPKINQKELSGLIVKIPTLPEQKEIVLILNSLFEKEQKAKEFCDVIEKIDLMKKAILARAFRGELGTNDPNEESAVELLKECLNDN
ncbi:type I restriction enzyme S subunit [Anaerobacterium chartisolvens]|uniref:Type I restriction enzyme S subunit n=1 Tax=Anaerobacterium chartisolvens TaxID=1297424 RepID=A0A369AU59_9FIRM|nr:restriction endonuclease subunit S [Anaerobacterium chartisolvens]RCX12751.1 type I restriction enzyme S subunit [Anaerobacterium chartisolvens]